MKARRFREPLGPSAGEGEAACESCGDSHLPSQETYPGFTAVDFLRRQKACLGTASPAVSSHSSQSPLQVFPAIRIVETELFTRSGKYNPWIKWQKNIFRFFVVMLCAAIAWGGADNLDKFVALVGNFACIPLVYIYPVSPFVLFPCICCMDMIC